MIENGFASACSNCTKKGVRIDFVKTCERCKRTNRYCSGCVATAINYGGPQNLSCRCLKKTKRPERA